MYVHAVKHPLARVLLTTMRDVRTDDAAFRSALRDLTTMLVYEATRDLPLERMSIETPVAPTDGYRLTQSPLLVPVLRAGLGMLDAAQQLLPDSQVGFIGLSRDEQTLRPKSYVTLLPGNLTGRSVLVLDPMLATGGSLEFAVRLLAERGASDITAVCVLAAPEGIRRMHDSGLLVGLVTASIDACLNEHGYIVPGLGDAGDRQFGAV